MKNAQIIELVSNINALILAKPKDLVVEVQYVKQWDTVLCVNVPVSGVETPTQSVSNVSRFHLNLFEKYNNGNLFLIYIMIPKFPLKSIINIIHIKDYL